jgi:glycerophosphoryl diester phosphodiesterase
MVSVLHAKGYAASAPYGSTAWQSRPIFIQSFEVTSLRRFAALTPVPLALLLDKGTAPDTGLPVSELLSDAGLSELSVFVTVMAPWKAMLYTLVDRQQQQQQQRQRPRQRPAPAAAGLVLPSAHTAANGTGTDSSRRLLGAQADASSSVEAADSNSGRGHGFSHPDVPLSAADRELQGAQQLQSTGLAARLHRHGFLVHTYTIRDEVQFVLPTCQQGISCEFEFLFGSERLDGGFADWPGTMRHWVQEQQQP